MDSKEFPTLEDVHVILSDLTNLFEDRNAMLHAMMKEDKYKDFLCLLYTSPSPRDPL